MGSSKKTYVSSQTYNIDGRYKDRVKFLQTTIIGGILNNPINVSLGNTVSSSYLGGPGIPLKYFVKWAERNNYWGITRQNKSYQKNPNRLNYDEIVKVLPKKGKGETYIIDVEIGYPSIDDYALQYMLDNVDNFYLVVENFTTYEDLKENYGCYIEVSNEDNNVPPGTIDIYYNNEKIKNLVIPENNMSKEYMVITYATKDSIDIHEVVNGMEDVPNPLYDSNRQWVEVENTIVETSQPKTTIIITTINKKTGEIIEIVEESSLEKVRARNGYAVYRYEREDGSIEYQKNTYREIIEDTIEEEIVEEEMDIATWIASTESEVPANTEEEEETPEQPEPEIPEEPEFYIVKKTINRNLITGNNSYELKIDDAYEGNTSMGVFIYEYGTGNKVLDAQLKPSSSDSSLFFPIIPFRSNNRNISKDHWGSIYNINKKAFKKLTKGSYDDLLKQINKSGSLGDINTGFMQLGVALNTRDPSAKSYIYEYFRLDLLNNGASVIDLDNPKSPSDQEKEKDKNKKVNILFAIRPKPSGVYFNSDLGYSINFRYSGGRIERKKGRYGNLKNNQIHIKYEYKYLGRYCYEYEYISNKKEGYTDTRTRCVVNDRMEYKIYKQFEDYYEIIYVYDPRHINTIKNGKSVTSYPFDYNQGEEESACILPLSAAAIKNMSLKDVTQLSYGIKHLTFTAWKEVKKKWYQSGIFKIAFSIVSIALVIYLPTIGLGASAGILGSSMSLGISMGFSGTAALVAGAAANAIAGVVLSSILTSASSKLFGESFGGIVSKVASFAIANFSFDGSFSFDFSQVFEGLLKADNILSLATSVGKGYLEYTQKSKFNKLADLQKNIEELNSANLELNKKLQDDFGKMGILDPLDLIDPFEGFIEGESRDDFISRTLMLGSDVVNISHNLIYNFTQQTLNLSLD